MLVVNHDKTTSTPRDQGAVEMNTNSSNRFDQLFLLVNIYYIMIVRKKCLASFPNNLVFLCGVIFEKSVVSE